MLGADGPESLRNRRIARSFKCVGCGYDLQGIGAMGTCPECGMSIRRSIRETIDEIWRAVPYAVDLIGGPYLDMNDEICDAFRPKTARRR